MARKKVVDKMSILSSNNLTGVNNLLNELGLNQWQIQQGTYNGRSFSVAQSPFSLNGLVNNLSTVGQVGTLVSAGLQISNATTLAAGAITGTSIDNILTKIPSGANAVTSSSVDLFTKKVAINELPNGKDNIRSLGYNGQEITIIAVAWGTNYMSYMNNNLVQMFYSDESTAINSPANYHVLQHPIFGTIKNCWLLTMRIIHDSSKWRSCIVELRFRTEEPIAPIANPNQILQQINDGISGILGIANGISNLWGSLNTILNGNNSQQQSVVQNNIYLQNSLSQSQSAVLASTNNVVATLKLIVNTLAPTNYNNVSLNNYITTTPSITQFNSFIFHSTPNDIGNLNDYLAANINATITTIYASVTPNNFYDTIDNLKSMLAQIGQISILLLNSYYGQVKSYTVPSTMSLFRVCSQNNIDYESNYQKIIQLNQNNFFWLNQLTKGTTVLLPISTGITQ